MGPRLAEEVAALEAYNSLVARTDAEKDVDDSTLWSQWLGEYRARLTAEADAALQQHRQMHTTLPQSTPGTAISSSSSGGSSGGSSFVEEEAVLNDLRATRQRLMAHANPKYVLRTWIAQAAIVAAEGGDYAVVQRVLERMRDPYGLTDPLDPVATTSSSTTSSSATSTTGDESAQASGDAAISAAGSAAGDGSSGSVSGPAGRAAASASGDKTLPLDWTHSPAQPPPPSAYGCKPPPWAVNLKVSCSS